MNNHNTMNNHNKNIDKSINKLNKLNKINEVIEVIDLIEPFDGIRKDKSRVIFGILLTIIIIDTVIECAL